MSENSFPQVRMTDLRQAAETALDLQSKSTKVVGWYPHDYGDERAQGMKTVRGPFCRWFALMEGADPDRAGKSQGCLADPADDIKYAAHSLNNMGSLAQAYLTLLAAIENPELILAANWKDKFTNLLQEYKELSEANGKKFDALIKQGDKIAELMRSDEEWNRIATELRAKVRFFEVGAHHCPDWDEMELKEGMVEFAVCTCNKAKG